MFLGMASLLFSYGFEAKRPSQEAGGGVKSHSTDDSGAEREDAIKREGSDEAEGGKPTTAGTGGTGLLSSSGRRAGESGPTVKDEDDEVKVEAEDASSASDAQEGEAKGTGLSYGGDTEELRQRSSKKSVVS
jgi:hypothetical protein